MLWRLAITIVASGLAFLMCGAQWANAGTGPMTGNQLYAICTATQEIDACDGYILGISDGVALMSPKAFCMTAGVDMQQMHDVVVNFLVKSASMRDKPAAYLVFWGLASAFHCPG